MFDIKKYRDEFHYLKSGKIYLNHAAISPLPKCVKDRIDNYLNIRYQTEIEPYYETLAESAGAKEKIALILGVNETQVSWAPNVSSAMNILTNGISLEYGDEIILNDIEFPSNVYPFLNLSKQGVSVKFAENRNGIVDVEEIEKLITQRTKIVSISMVQFLSGYRADLKSIGEICKAKNIIFCVDGIQGIGTVQIDVDECGIDFFAGGSHKWLMGLQGLGYFYISKKLMDILEHKNVGWTSVKNPWKLLSYDLVLSEGAKRFENGTLPRIAIIALNASLSFLEEIGMDQIEKLINKNTLFLREKLGSLGFDKILGTSEQGKNAGIVSFAHKNSDLIFKELERKNIICSLREGIIRLSPHFYNTEEELSSVVAEIDSIVKDK
ncbi:MAG: aminotransferase class V-fold PLP-dependent enzyme [Melioribacteraceae bacterium]|nr:aminotransferase class V-fold PLP-dependent enzyme [Melioribacteraceae bacterium]